MITIHSATGDHRQQLFSLIATIPNFTPAEQELAREVIEDALAPDDRGYHVLVALDEKRSLSGFICFGPIPITVKRWDIYWIAVAPESSRQGIGTLLLEAMETRLGPGVRVYVDTSATVGYAKARSFYEHHGYRVACTLADFYGVGDDKIMYSKDL